MDRDRPYVEYTNGAVSTPMGRLRAANGHPEPYGVRYWGIGNEAWGDWQFGAMSLAQFVVKHNMFANATIVEGQKPGVAIEEQALDAVPGTPSLAPFSVNVYAFPVK